MNIGILSRSTELYSTRSLYRAGKRRGHAMHVIDHTRCSLMIDAAEPNIFYQSKPLDFLDAVIPRIGASVTGLGAAVINQFELMGIVSPTSPEALQLARDKLRSFQTLVQHQIPVPKTFMINPSEDLKEIVEKLGGFPVVVKMLESTHGEGVELAHNAWSLQRIMSEFFRYENRLLMQEYIAEARGADTRVLVVDGQIIASMRRQAKPGEFRSNLHRGASSIAIQLKPEEENLVKEVVRVLNIEVAGVDLLPSSQGPLVMEVNASPGLEGIEGTTGKDVAGAIIRLVEKKVKANKRKD
ncbi:RimK family alpha-L-glutamate ligase [Lewinella sp. LCG006]|uniref:ATP-grasp domain-containing protein n=1 Tax=Lewinella sp. LCG006 TaxID=3231911 RepID=UPI00346121E0